MFYKLLDLSDELKWNNLLNNLIENLQMFILDQNITHYMKIMEMEKHIVFSSLVNMAMYFILS